MARRRMTAEQAADKWERKMQTASTDYVAGVEAVTENPMEAAAAAAPKYQRGVQESVESGRYQRGLTAVSLSDWKDNAKTKGAARLASGAAAAAPKMRMRMQQLMSNVEEVQSIINRMPSDTPEQRIERATAWMREMHKRPIK